MERRQFLQGLTVAGVLGALPLDVPPTVASNQGIPYRTLGRTGEKVSVIGLGGAHIGRGLSEADGIQLVRAAIDRGGNFLDNSWDYNNGDSEIRMGKALKDGYRQKVFLMTKLDGRTKQEATRQLDESLARLQTDHLDLLQHHEVIRYEDPDRIFAEGGAQEALIEARRAGKVRYIGFTGHKDPHVHLYMLEVAQKRGFHFDTVQMPLNVMDAHFRSFAHLVVPELVDRQIGILGMKSMGGGVILKSGLVTPVECLHYAMNLPTSVVITGINKASILDQAIDAAKSFAPMSRAAVEALLAKTRQAGSEGQYELFKTSQHFDATAKHPEWLGGESPHVQQVTNPA
ncbi:MAG: aldo/keto reductase [Acidobacteria bacterium]|nr:aldo/keto reductase [Acidobacteriota bacterium]